MADTTVETTGDGVGLTIAQVTDPNGILVTEGALASAKQAQLKRARESYTEVSGLVLASVTRRRGQIAQRVSDLQAELAGLQKEDGKLQAAIAAADTPLGSILPLAAVVGCKTQLIDFMRANNIVVPKNDSPEWDLPA